MKIKKKEKKIKRRRRKTRTNENQVMHNYGDRGHLHQGKKW
jgi:hypothetical protein